MMRRARPVAGVALLVAALAGCVAERDRLDVPVVTLALGDSIVAPGDSVRGTVTARDASGLVYLTVSARAADSVYRFGPLNFAPLDSIQRTFRLRVPADAGAGALVIVTATAIDDQQFTVEVTDTVAVRPRGVPIE
jgi:hypothetical protein